MKKEPDLEKTIELIQEMIDQNRNSVVRYVYIETLMDILFLLKNQEAKNVNISQTHYGMKYGLCPQCGKQIDTLVNPNYCGYCGQELKWDE